LPVTTAIFQGRRGKNKRKNAETGSLVGPVIQPDYTADYFSKG